MLYRDMIEIEAAGSAREANGRRTGSCGIVSADSVVVDVRSFRGENLDWNNIGIQ